jgi:hypothetical protein
VLKSKNCKAWPATEGGFDPEPTLDDRVFRAMQFRVGGDECAVAAKEALYAS